jgi:predicted nucleotide-binding protein (sugar kinase/HSP70/actin superfamily)
MEFEAIHDKVDNIPISLELRNLPSIIQSLAQIHGLSTNGGSSNNIHQISDKMVDCEDNTEERIHMMGH